MAPLGWEEQSQVCSPHSEQPPVPQHRSQARAKASQALIGLKAGGIIESPRADAHSAITHASLDEHLALLSMQRQPSQQLFRRCCDTETKLSALPPLFRDPGGQHLSLTGTPQSAGHPDAGGRCRPVADRRIEGQRCRDMAPDTSPSPPAALTHDRRGTKPAGHGPL